MSRHSCKMRCSHTRCCPHNNQIMRVMHACGVQLAAHLWRRLLYTLGSGMLRECVAPPRSPPRPPSRQRLPSGACRSRDRSCDRPRNRSGERSRDRSRPLRTDPCPPSTRPRSDFHLLSASRAPSRPAWRLIPRADSPPMSCPSARADLRPTTRRGGERDLHFAPPLSDSPPSRGSPRTLEPRSLGGLSSASGPRARFCLDSSRKPPPFVARCVAAPPSPLGFGFESARE